MSDVALKPVWTSAGLAAVAAAHGQGLALKVTHLAVGDAGQAIRDENGLALDSARALTALTNEKVRVTLDAAAPLNNYSTMMKGSVPADADEFWIKEIGFIDENGTLVAYWSDASSNLGWRGAVVPWEFQLSLSWKDLPANAIVVEFTDAVMGDMLAALAAHDADPNAHATLMTAHNADRDAHPWLKTLGVGVTDNDDRAALEDADDLSVATGHYFVTVNSTNGLPSDFTGAGILVRMREDKGGGGIYGRDILYARDSHRVWMRAIKASTPQPWNAGGLRHDTKETLVTNIWSAPAGLTVVAGGGINPDFTARNVFNLTMTQNLVLNAPVAGGRPDGNDVRVNFVQDASGGHTLDFGPGYVVKGSWSSAPNAINVVTLSFDVPGTILARIDPWEV